MFKSDFFHELLSLVSLSLLFGFPPLYSDTLYSVGYLGSRDRPVPEIFTWEHSTLTTLISMPRRDSNIQTQQASGLRPSP